MSNRAFTRFADNGGALLTAAQVDANFDGIYRPYSAQNFLFNPDALLDNQGWTGTTFGSTKSPTIGYMFRNGAAIAAPAYDESAAIAASAAVSYTVSTGLWFNGTFTAGTAYASLAAYDSTGTFISEFAVASYTAGSGGTPPTLLSATGTTPANTATIKVRKGVSGSTVTVSASSIGFLYLKCEMGAYVSPPSDEMFMRAFSGSPPFLLSPIFQAVQAVTGTFTGTVNAVNNPNLLFNGSFEFGGMGWTLSANLSVATDTTGGIGTFLTNSSAIAATAISAASPSVLVGPATNVCESFDIANYSTSGSIGVSLTAYNSSNVKISDISTMVVTNGTALTRYSLSGVTPALTASVKLLLYSGGTAPTVAAFGIVMRRCKIENGLNPSLYSQETTVDAMARGVVAVPTGNRNHIIDGNFDYFLATTLTNPANVATKNFATMYVIYSGVGGVQGLSIANLQTSDVAFAKPITNGLVVNQSTASTGTVAATTAPYIAHYMEKVNRFTNKSATFSCWLWTSTGTVTIPSVIARQIFGTGGSTAVIIDKAVNWVITTTPQRFSVRLDIPSVNGKTIGTDNCLMVGVWLPPAVTFTIGTTQWQCEESSPWSSSDLNGAGGAPTPFEYRGESQEEARVLRLYEVVSTVVTPQRADFYSPLMFKYRKRKVPTITWYSSATLAAGYIRDNDNARDVPVTGNAWTSVDGCGPIAGSSPTLAVGANTTISANVDARL